MTHSYVTIKNFRAWLEDTQADAVPCDTAKCVLALWLVDAGFQGAQVDGELIYEPIDHEPTHDFAEPLSMVTPQWCHSIMSVFDGMSRESANLVLGLQPRLPVSASEYRAPLLACLNHIEGDA